MKTYHLKDLLKKELLIVELPENNWLSIFPRLILICDRETNEYHHIKGSYTLLGSPDEIKEDNVRDLVEIVVEDDLLGVFYKNYKNPHYMMQPTSAIESFNSALEKEILWKNPIKIPSSDDINWFRNQPDSDFSERYTRVFDWYKAQEKTFDKKRVKILVKN